MHKTKTQHSFRIKALKNLGIIGQVWGPIIAATWKAKIGRISARGHSGQKKVRLHLNK
jgi:hypothetical protein